MNTSKSCGTCKFWGYENQTNVFRTCIGIPHREQFSESEGLAYTEDRSNYDSRLMTKAEFSCCLFEIKNNIIYIDMDWTPRYAPSMVMTLNGEQPVISYDFHLVGQHPEGCPIKKNWGALELKTMQGSRWYGCIKAYINSELRMVVIGTPRRDEVRMKWDVCHTI